MKVILTQEVKGKGSEGDVVDVARGYAVNFLLPKKLAVEATSGNLKQLEARRHNIEERESARRTAAEGLAAAIEGKVVYVEAKVGDEGRLYGSVTGQMVADAIQSQLDVDVDRRRLDAHGHIKTLGEHPVTVQIHRDVKVDLVVEVVPEGGTEAARTAPAAEVVEASTPEVEVAEAAALEAEDEVPVEEPAAEEAATEEPAAEGAEPEE